MYPNVVNVTSLTSVKKIGDSLVGIASPGHYLVYSGSLVGKFDGINALFDYQAKFQATARHSKGSDASKSSDPGFYHFNSFNQAIDVYRNDPKVVADFKPTDFIIDGGDSAGRDILFDVTGDMLDVGRYLSNEPDCMASLTNGNPRNKRVNIIIGLDWGAPVTPDIINTRATRLIRLIDWLESQSIRTQVIGMSSNTCIHIEVLVKHFDEPLNINDIAVIGHSDFLRRVQFRFTEYSKCYRSNYGSAGHLARHFMHYPQQYASDYNDEYTLLIDGYMADSPEDINNAFDRLEADIAKQLSNDKPGNVIHVTY